jgi:hypothetical protein
MVFYFTTKHTKLGGFFEITDGESEEMEGKPLLVLTNCSQTGYHG